MTPQSQPGTGASPLWGACLPSHNARVTFSGVSMNPCPEGPPHMATHRYGEEDVMENSACDFAFLSNLLRRWPLPTAQLPNCSEPAKAF